MLCALLSACTEPPPATQVLVVVHAESEALASELSTLKVRLFPVGATDPTEAIEDREFALTTGLSGEGKYSLPLSFGIEKNKEARFLLELRAFRKNAAAAVIEHKLIGSFVAQQSMLIEVVLRQVCYDRAQECEGLDQTCYGEALEEIAPGTCGPVREAEMRPVRAGEELTPHFMDIDAGLGAAATDEPDASDDEGGADADAAPPVDAAQPPAAAALGRSGEACSPRPTRSARSTPSGASIPTRPLRSSSRPGPGSRATPCSTIRTGTGTTP